MFSKVFPQKITWACSSFEHYPWINWTTTTITKIMTNLVFKFNYILQNWSLTHRCAGSKCLPGLPISRYCAQQMDLFKVPSSYIKFRSPTLILSSLSPPTLSHFISFYLSISLPPPLLFFISLSLSFLGRCG